MAIIFSKTRCIRCLPIALSAAIAACASSPYKGSVTTVTKPLAMVQDRFANTGDSSALDANSPDIGAANAGIELNADRPETYVVERGDTLWDISGRFLKEPWLWPQVWEANPAIEDPHLIYPGDKISLTYNASGQPMLQVSRNGQLVGGSSNSLDPASNVVKLSPRIRSESLAQAIPMIPGESIQQFLVYPRVVSSDQLSKAPYVIGNAEGHLASAVNDRFYARGRINRDQPTYGVFRRSKALIDPVTNEMLGHEVTHVADARLEQVGDPHTLRVTSNKMETIAGDRLMTNSQHNIAHSYIPRMPSIQGEGRVVSLVDAISQSGRNQIIVLNLGERSGIKTGDVLAIERRGGTIIDKFASSGNKQVTLPNTRTGVVMVFQTFDKVSYGLVMESTQPILKNDIVAEI